MSWQEAFLNKIHFNAFVAAIGVVGAWLWFSNKVIIAGIAALIITVYFFFLIIIFIVNNYRRKIQIEQQERKNREYKDEQWRLECTKVKFWYAATNQIVRVELRKLLTFEIVDNDPLARVCHRERGEYFNFNEFAYQLPGTDVFRPKYAVTRIDANNGNEIYYIHPYLYQLLISDESRN